MNDSEIRDSNPSKVTSSAISADDQNPATERQIIGSDGNVLAEIVKVPYGHPKSKYAIAFRMKSGASGSLNVVTFKLVANESPEQPKWNMQAKYVTLPSQATGQPGSGSKTEPPTIHAEEVVINSLLQGLYPNIDLNGYWVKWIYSERVSCLGLSDNSCDRAIRDLLASQTGKRGSHVAQVFYSFDVSDPAEEQIAAEIERRKREDVEYNLVNKNKNRNPMEVEKRERFYEDQLVQSVEYARAHHLF